MSADYRVTAAREFLAGARTRKVTELPPSLLIREGAELRRLLGQLLTLVDDFKAEEQARDITELTPSGGARISPADLAVVLAALSDAVYCGEGHGIYDVVPGDAAVAAYRVLARSLGDDRR